MIRALLEKIASNPRIYDVIQRAAGSEEILRRMAASVEAAQEGVGAASVLDVGGGTGLTRELWPDEALYVCLDNDPIKLAAFRKRFPSSHVLLSDGACMGIRNDGFGVVIIKFVFHHIPDALAREFLRECTRVLEPGGKLIFVEALWLPSRLRSRLLWRFDRGRWPRAEASLRAMLSEHLDIVHWERFSTIHRFVLCVAEKQTGHGARRSQSGSRPE